MFSTDSTNELIDTTEGTEKPQINRNLKLSGLGKVKNITSSSFDNEDLYKKIDIKEKWFMPSVQSIEKLKIKKEFKPENSNQKNKKLLDKINQTLEAFFSSLPGLCNDRVDPIEERPDLGHEEIAKKDIYLQLPSYVGGYPHHTPEEFISLHLEFLNKYHKKSKSITIIREAIQQGIVSFGLKKLPDWAITMLLCLDFEVVDSLSFQDFKFTHDEAQIKRVLINLRQNVFNHLLYASDEDKTLALVIKLEEILKRVPIESKAYKFVKEEINKTQEVHLALLEIKKELINSLPKPTSGYISTPIGSEMPVLKRSGGRRKLLNESIVPKHVTFEDVNRYDKYIKLFQQEDLDDKTLLQTIIDIKQTCINAISATCSNEEKIQSIVSTLTEILEQLPFNHFPNANRLVSLEIGKMTLRPMNIINSEVIESAHERSLQNICTDLYRSIHQYKVNVMNRCILDGNMVLHGIAFQSKEDVAKRCLLVEQLQNCFYQKVIKSRTGPIPSKIISDSNDSSVLGRLICLQLETTLISSLNTEIDKNLMKKYMGLGSQSFLTRSISVWEGDCANTLPTEYSPRNANSKSGLKITEKLTGTHEQKLSEIYVYDRHIEINFTEDSSLTCQVLQPVTFNKKSLTPEGDYPLGFVYVETNYTFDNKMNCISRTQKLKPAMLIEKKYSS